MPLAVFPARLESLAPISEFVIEAAEAAGLDELSVYAVQLAVDEACTNIIEHAYGGQDNGEIECECETTAEGLKITIRDWGAAFDPASVPEPDLSQPLEDISPRGAGLMMIRKSMDEVHFEFNEQGNTLVLVKRK